MSDEKLNEKRRVLAQVAGFIGSVAIATIAWTIVAQDGAILEKQLFSRSETALETIPIFISQPVLISPQTPSQPEQSVLPLPDEIYEYQEGGQTRVFVRVSDVVWHEVNEFGETFNTFKEIERDSNFIIIYDKERRMKIKIPIERGYFLITWEPRGWIDIPYRYVVKKADTK
ncbi:hypothetical protein [Thermoleptolyngbya sp. C42_A2020_037]|uniref:hypothetical protein n=1 Tax=Thermoleptolyngbya sp. C42_A2020_037 TaxID=2747799 RepID=UPI001A107569|nr:hypothetical protein [Thermoleptolyngbya sp. C42_A2020_037]MBF2085462.1 hypothetical protein [Thermoleptolyngbya sp. C42_A2020_037]